MIARSHPLVRRLRALRHDRARREAEGVVVAEGVHLAHEALRHAAAIEAAIVSPRLSTTAEGRSLAARLREAVVELHEAPDELVASVQDARTAQPVVAIVRRAAVGLEDVCDARGDAALVVLACGVQDPGNLGALLRTAEAAGATGCVTTPGSADLTHPRTVRASMGSILRLPAVELDGARALERIRARGLVAVGAFPREAADYDRYDWTQPTALVLGGEGGGIPGELVRFVDVRVRIPMAEGVESVSVAAAAAVLLFEAARARRPRGAIRPER